MKRETPALYAAIALIWGSSWIAEQSVSGLASPLAAGALRFTIGAVVLVPFCRGITLEAARQAAVLGLFMLALPYGLAVWAGVHGAGGWAPLVYSALPLLAAAATWRPAMITAVGATLLVLNGSFPLSIEKALWAAPIVFAAASQAFALHYARCHPLRTTGLALQLVLAAAALALSSEIFEPAPRLAPLASWTGADLLWLAALGGLATALAYGVYYRLLRDLTPAQAASTQWLQLVVTVLGSALIFRQRPPLSMLAGLAALLVCAWRLLFQAPDENVTIRLKAPP